MSKHNYLAVYMMATFVGMSAIPHKEMRFLSSLLLPFAICWAAAFNTLATTFPSLKNLLSLLLRIYLILEVVTAIDKHAFVRHGDSDLYASMAADSPTLLHYDSGFKLPQVESVYQFNTIDSPGTAWLHVQGPKITIIV